MNLKTVVLLIVLTNGVLGAHNITIIFLFPLSGSVTNWKRGHEILPGTYVAMNHINKDLTLLSNYNLQLIVVDSGTDENKVLEQTIDFLFYQSSLNIVGVSGFLSPKTVSALLPLVRHRGILLSAATEQYIPESCNVVQAIVSPSTVVMTIQSLIKRINWKQIGIITDNSDPYFFRIAEMLVRTSKDFYISPYIELLHFKSAIHEITQSGTRAIFVSLRSQIAVQLMCKLNNKDLLWPKYAWIFLSFDIESILEEKADCNIKNALNGILIIDIHPQSAPNTNLISGISYLTYHSQYLSFLGAIANDYNLTLRPNKYAEILYDLMWQIAITLNESCYLSSACKPMNEALLQYFNYDIVRVATIFQIRTFTQVLASAVHYNSVVTEVSLNKTMLASFKLDEVIMLSTSPPIAYTTGISILITFTAIFLTLMLVLYICFHTEPEIKATSFSLSLLMYAGCYFNLFYIVLLYYSVHTTDTIDIQHQHVICNLFLWLSAPGISLPLMLAVLLVKIARIYHIFKNVKVGLGRCCSNLSLAGYVAMILSPNILVNIIWIFSDRYHVKLEHRTQNGYAYVRRECSSTYENIWIGVQTIYILVLIVALVVIAIMTRKVRLQHFKDTKKVNFLLYILCPGMAITFFYWLLFQILNSKLYVITIPLHIGHSSLIISFQCFLIVPKVYPPLWRRLKRKSQQMPLSLFKST